MPECSWRRGFPAKRVPAEVAYDELERVRAETGGALRPRDVVEAARAPGTVLHPLFQWDDQAAAEAHRLARARTLLRSLVVIQEVTPQSAPAPAYVRVRMAEQPGSGSQSRYVPIDVALRSPLKREELLLRALQDLLAWQARYRDLRELADVFSAIEDIRGELQPLVS